MTAQPQSTQESTRRRYYNDTVAQTFADQLMDGTSPLQSGQVAQIPYNPASGRSFSGMNALTLQLQQRRDDRWMTKDEARIAGLRPADNQEPVPVRYWRTGADGETRHATLSWVYNGEQLLGMPPMPKKPERPDPLDRVRDILEHSGANIVYDRNHSGYYNPKTDTIHLPTPEKIGTQEFCEDAIYQYTRSTAHPDRLNRETFNPVGTFKESQEAFICSIATMQICADLGIPSQPHRAVDYADMWSKSAVNRPIEFSKDMAQAEGIVAATLVREHERLKVDPEQELPWLPVMEATPYGAVKTYLERGQVLEAIEKAPDTLDRFEHEGKEIFALSNTGYRLASKDLDEQNPDRGKSFLIKTEAFDRDGNTYDVTMSYDVSLDENGMAERITDAEARRILPTERTMSLPRDWNGELKIQACRENADGGIEKSDTPSFYGILAKTDSGNDQYVAAFNSQRDAQKYTWQVHSQYQYLGSKLGLDVDFESLKHPDRSAPKAPQKNQASRTNSQADREIEPTEDTRQLCIKAMEAVGFKIDGNHPIFDGKGHRIDLAGDEKGKLNGWYVAHIDRTPGGTCINHKTKQRTDWSNSRGIKQTNTVKEQLVGIAKQKHQTEKREAKELNSEAVDRLQSLIKSKFIKPESLTPYLEKKGLPLDPGIYQNKATKSTCIPIMDTSGNIHSMAYIQEDGTKRYAKGTDKTGHFYPIGGLDSLQAAPVLNVCEGYSTGATVAMASKLPCVVGFDSGNLPSVIDNLKQTFPEKPVILWADDDRHLPLADPPLPNSGRESAEAIAEAMGVTVAFPHWEKGTPADRNHTDFDDIRREKGLEEVRSQVEPVIEKVLEKHQEQEQRQEQTRSRGSLFRT